MRASPFDMNSQPTIILENAFFLFVLFILDSNILVTSINIILLNIQNYLLFKDIVRPLIFHVENAI